MSADADLEQAIMRNCLSLKADAIPSKMMRRSKTFLSVTSLAIGWLLAPVQALATVVELPDASYQVIYGPTDVADKPGSYTGPFGTASITALPALVLTASNAGPSGTSTSAFVVYNFSVVGPDCGCLVPISIAASLSGDSTPDPAHGYNAGFYSELRVDAFDEARKYLATPNGLEPFADSWTGKLLVHAIVGNVNGVLALARAENLSAHAYVDPEISIDPSFALIDPTYLTDYSIVLSPGVGNSLPAGAVPEPATWGLMLGGFGLTGAVLRRRRAAVA